jgi:uncharacterized protein (TIGR02145 family)
MNIRISYIGVIVCTLVLVSCNEQQTAIEPGGDTELISTIAKKAGTSGSPVINGVSPASAEIGDVLTITGSAFSPKQNSGYHVTFNGIAATVYRRWSKDRIEVLVPSGSPIGDCKVAVVMSLKTSNEVDFTLLSSSPVTIGTQTWMGANLDVVKYRNGDPIPEVSDPTAWGNLATGAWCYPDNDPAKGALTGKLYNWYAVNDPRGLAPAGWHIPTQTEWKTLFMYLGMTQAEADGYGYPPDAYHGTTEGGQLKEEGTSLWLSQNVGATNYTGFTALPAGYRNTSNGFSGYRTAAGWWAATDFDQNRAWMRMVVYYYANTYHNNLPKTMGFSVRCIQDN